MRLWFCSVSIPRGLEKAHDRKGLRTARPGKPDVLLLRLWEPLDGERNGFTLFSHFHEEALEREAFVFSAKSIGLLPPRGKLQKHSDFALTAKQALATTKWESRLFPTARHTSLDARGLFFNNPESQCNSKALTPLKIQIFSAFAQNWRFREVLSHSQNAKRPVNPLTSLFSLCLCRPMTQVWGQTPHSYSQMYS